MVTLDKTFAVGELLTAANVNDHLLGLWIPIDKRVIASGSPVSSVSFQSLDTNFRFFRLTFGAISGSSGTGIRLNNDSGAAAYTNQQLYADGSTVVASRFTLDTVATAAGAEYIAGQFIIMKSLATQRARIIGMGSGTSSASVYFLNNGAFWSNTTSLINRIDLLCLSGTMHGVFALEGMRGV